MISYIFRSIIIGLGIGCFIILLNPHFLDKNYKTEHNLINDNNEPSSYSYAIERSAPSVVNIYVKSTDESYNGSNNINNSSKIISSASGIIVTETGYILTNYHVIMAAITGINSIGVQLRDGTTFQGRIIGYDKRTDIAVLKVNSKQKLQPIHVNPNRETHLGDVVLAIGNPYNLGQTITHGIISAVGRSGSGVTNFNTMDLTAGIQELIQTDAPINEGNSGGALVNSRGEFIGMNTATLSNTDAQANGISFAIPQGLALRILNDIIKHGKAVRGYLGIRTSDITELPANTGNFNNDISGIIIKEVDSKGKSNGILELNDISISINNTKVNNLREAMEIIADSIPGAEVKFEILRNGKLIKDSIYVGEQPNL